MQVSKRSLHVFIYNIYFFKSDKDRGLKLSVNHPGAHHLQLRVGGGGGERRGRERGKERGGRERGGGERGVGRGRG